MAVTVWPVNAVAGAPAYSGRMIRQASGLLVAQNPARPLGGVSGIAAGSGVVVSVSGTTYTVGVHRGVLDLETSPLAGSYFYANDAAVALTGTAANATNPRNDLVVATLSDPAEADGSSAPSVVFSVVTGVAAASPADPSVPARSLAIARVSVPKVGGGAATVTMLCPEVGASGTPVRVRSAAQRDALTPYEGMQVFRLDTGATEQRSGSVWVPSGQTFPVTQAALAGSPPPAGARMIVQGVSDSAAVNYSGDIRISLPQAFPNGMVSIVGTPGALGCTNAVAYSYDLVSAVFRCYNGTALVTNGSFARLNVVAVGW